MKLIVFEIPVVTPENVIREPLFVVAKDLSSALLRGQLALYFERAEIIHTV
jgi:hypothetical protein